MENDLASKKIANEIAKLEYEGAKLKLEIATLRSPLRSFLRNPGSWLTGLTALVGVLAFVWQVQLGKIEKAKVDLEVAQLEEKAKALTNRKTGLEADEATLLGSIKRLENSRAQYEQEVALLEEKIKTFTVATRSVEKSFSAGAELKAQAGVAATAAGELTAQAAQFARSAGQIPARVYIQIESELQRSWAVRLSAEFRTLPDLLVPNIENVGSKMQKQSESEVRYFREADRVEAEKLRNILQQAVGDKPVKMYLPSGFLGKTRPRHFEIWLKE